MATAKGKAGKSATKAGASKPGVKAAPKAAPKTAPKTARKPAAKASGDTDVAEADASAKKTATKKAAGAKAGTNKAAAGKPAAESASKKAPAKKASTTTADEPVAAKTRAKKSAKPAPANDDAPAGEIASARNEAAAPAGEIAGEATAPADETAAVESEAPAAAPSPADEPPFPETRYPVVEKLLVSFVGHEVRKVGLSRAVLGLSGGIDSAVSAAIAARALGAENVLAVFMPYSSSVPESQADANEVVRALGIESMTVEITPQVDAYFARYPDALRLRRGNKMARERMTILYDLSAARSALVVGTSNKTELLLGYGTLYGDMASALNPIGDLYKTQVWGLARHLGLPASVIDKAPTADLWSGQTDENELGFSYHRVDRLLFRMIDERASTAELVEMGFDPAFVERISRMVRSSQFKRRLPIIAKISARSIDTDFRYSRDWGL